MISQFLVHCKIISAESESRLRDRELQTDFVLQCKTFMGTESWQDVFFFFFLARKSCDTDEVSLSLQDDRSSDSRLA